MEKPPRMEVVRRAYELWEQAGKPEGRDQEFYLQAERELSTPPATPEEKSANPDEKSETFLE